MKKETISTIILISYIFLFSALTYIYLLSSDQYWVDGLTAVGCCLFFLIVHYRFLVHPFIAFLEGLLLVPNQLGFAFLYNLKSINYHGDWFIHFTTAMLAAIVLMYYVRRIRCIRDHVITIAILSFALTVTGGSIVELAEYWGFIIFGFGNSYLAFGVGDNSLNFGPWENSSLDVSFNFLGALLGIAIYFLYLKYLTPRPGFEPG